MTIASDEATVGEAWPEGVPHTTEEMLQTHGAYVSNLLRKYNKVGRNYEELHSYVWQRLVELNVIQLYMENVDDKMQSTMTALEACAVLGVSFGQWHTKMWAYHKGDPVIRGTGKNRRIICRRLGGWMPTPVNLDDFHAKGLKGYTAKTALFETDDIARLMMMERELKNGDVVGPFNKRVSVPQITKLKLKATKGHFQSYLARTIYTNFLNWCRTYRRKWALDQPRKLPTDTEHEEHDWEVNIPDPSGTRQETVAVLKQAYTRLSETLYESMEGVESCKPVAQYEIQMFDLLEQGITLPEVVKQLEVPDHVRRAVLRSVADLRTRAA